MSKRGGFPGGMGGFGGMNMNQLMKQAKKMQEDMEKTQEELQEKTFEATAGGNAVYVKVNGAKVLKWMQENEATMANTFTSKEIAEGLFTSGRSIAGSMRKLVADEYVDKTGKNPIQYSLTDKGKNVNV